MFYVTTSEEDDWEQPSVLDTINSSKHKSTLDWFNLYHRCFHGIGFEVYGNVYEEWSNESNRIEYLEDQNEMQKAGT